MPHLTSNDIILDCGNEHYANTERRQAKCKDTGIHYLGVGISGGHQAARAGPSMCPGGDKEALNTVMPLLEQIAAKDKEGKPCVGMVGRGGAGHYVKMVHNGIEHGMMSAISEAWGIMRAMGMEYEEIGDVFGKWNEGGELVCVPNLRFSLFSLRTTSRDSSRYVNQHAHHSTSAAHTSFPSAPTSSTNATPPTTWSFPPSPT